MSEIKGYDDDIFISYAHVDNLSDENEGWVDIFHRKLGFALSKRVGETNKIKIWRDKELKGNEEFDNIIEDRVHKSALFLSITSNGYLKSNYCIKELQCFFENAKHSPYGLSVENKYRIFNILISNIDHKRFPEELGRTSCFKLFDNKGRPLKPNKEEYEDHIYDIADAIISTIDIMKGSKPIEPDQLGITHASQPIQTESKYKDFPVFFAEVPDSLRDDKDFIVKELQEAGIQILDEIPPPDDSESHEKAVIKSAKHARMSVHLLDQYPTKKIKKASLSYDQKQLQLCLDHCKSQWIWVPKDLNIETISNETHRNIITNLYENMDQLPYAFIQGIRTEIKQDILESIERLYQKNMAADPVSTHNKVLLAAHIEDDLYADDIINLLSDNNIVSYINKITDNPKEKIEQFEKQLSKSGALIIIYANSQPDWVNNLLIIAVKKIIERETIPTLAIYDPLKRNMMIKNPILKRYARFVFEKNKLLECVMCNGGAL